MRKAAHVVGCVCVCAFALYGKKIVDDRNFPAARPVPPVTEASAQYESHSLQSFSLGFGNAISDLLWVRLLQEANHKKLTAPGVSWEYAQLNAITNLDRNYARAYEFGSAFLSIFRQDKVGAKDILHKWTVNFPLMWKAHYIYGFHLYNEMGLYTEASKEILLAATLPLSPGWLNALGVRLMSQDGAYLPALHIAMSLYPSLTDDGAKERLHARIRSLRYHLQKLDWETALAEYRKQSHHEPGSLEELRATYHPGREVAEVESEIGDNDELREMMSERFAFRYDSATKKIEGLLSKQDQGLEISGTYHHD